MFIRQVCAVRYDDEFVGGQKGKRSALWNRIGNEGIQRSRLSNNVQGIGWHRLLDVNSAANIAVPGRIVNQLKIPQRVAVQFAIQDATGATVASVVSALSISPLA
jgi:hypothetical protein